MIKIAETVAKGNETIQLHPSKENWGVIALFSVIGSAPLVLTFTKLLPMTGAGQVALGLYAAFFLIPCAVFGYWQTRAVIIADDSGLKWRGLGKWHEAEWKEVTDYYAKLLPKSKTTLTIVTATAKFNIKSDIWGKAADFKKAIANKAIHAQVKEWEFFGARSEVDWPRIFHYNTSDNRFGLFVMPGMLTVAVAFYLWQIAPGFFRTLSTLGVGWAAATLGISLLGILPLALMSSIAMRVIGATARRRSQFITLNTDGLVFEGDNRRIEARWDDITGLVIEKPGRREIAPIHSVITTQGTFGFLASISEFKILCLALATHASSLSEAKWHSEKTDVLGGTASLWTSRREGVGKRVYHYRTCTNRSLLSLPLFFAVVPVLSILIQQWAGITIKGSAGFAYGMSLVLSLPVLLGIWRYSTAKIETDSDGITQWALGGARHLAWAEIEDYYQSGDDIFKFGNLKCKETKIRFWIGIANVEGLKLEIEKQAVNSLNRTWHRDSQDE